MILGLLPQLPPRGKGVKLNNTLLCECLLKGDLYSWFNYYFTVEVCFV